MIIRETDTRISAEEAVAFINKFESGDDFRNIELYKTYYHTENKRLRAKVEDREKRLVSPNNFSPTAYYKTIVDTMAGYMFQEVLYSGDEATREVLNQEDNEVETTDMMAGSMALAFNRAIELVYTTGEDGDIKIEFASVDPLCVTLIFDPSIKPELYAAIRKHAAMSEDEEYRFTIYYRDLEQTFRVLKRRDSADLTIEKVGEDRILMFSHVPIVVYHTDLLSEQSSFHQILTYIDALDWVITGNSNEVDRLVDAILALSGTVPEEAENHMDEVKFLENVSKEDFIGYIEKQSNPEFRRYVSDLLVREIHKHSHVIDWYSPDTGLSGIASGRALTIRLHDMEMLAGRIEKIFRRGTMRRISLIQDVLRARNRNVEPVEVQFERNIPSQFIDMLQQLSLATFISDVTKWEQLGLDVEQEQQRIDEQRASGSIDEPFDFSGINQQSVNEES